jgi:hypothetical protein
VLRIAANLEVMWNGWDVTAITRPSIERAIKVIRYHDAHYLHTFGRLVDGDGKQTQAPPAHEAVLEEFFSACTERSPLAETRADELLSALNAFATRKGLETWTAERLGKALERRGTRSSSHRPRVQIDGKLVRVRTYPGFQLKATAA